MEWIEEGYVVGWRRFGEGKLVLEGFTKERGRWAGLATRGRGGGAPMAPSRARLRWRGRLEEHLGWFGVESAGSGLYGVFDDAEALSALSWSCVLARMLPERDPAPLWYEGFAGFVEGVSEGGEWGEGLAMLEADFLRESGYGLSLERCALTGEEEGLAWASPRTGRAATAAAVEGGGYEGLLRLPGFMGGDGGGASEGLALTGYFLEKWILEPMGRRLSAERVRLAEKAG